MEQEPQEDEQEMLAALARLPAIVPPLDQRERFRVRARLAIARPKQTPRWIGLAIAASLLLMAGSGWWFDHARQHRETERLRIALVQAMSDRSDAIRFQAIRKAGDTPAGDSTIVAVLTVALLRDPSINVRVAAAEALGRAASATAFERAAQQSVAQDESPFVHSALLQASQRLSAGERRKFLIALLARTDLDPLVRARAEASIKS